MRDSTSTDATASGRFVLRLDPSLHYRLREKARDAGVSLNELCRRRLEVSAIDLPTALDAALAHADEKLPGMLLGIVVYGSWARGEATPESDIDLLFVLKPEAALDREIYRRWDDDPPTWDGMPLEPHFVRLPDPDREVTSTWAEAALDGIVLQDPSLMVSRAGIDPARDRRRRDREAVGARAALLGHASLMRNPELAVDYLRRATTRLRALDVYREAESWAAPNANRDGRSHRWSARGYSASILSKCQVH